MKKLDLKKIIFFLIGCIHGLTNLGGGFISIIFHFIIQKIKLKLDIQ